MFLHLFKARKKIQFEMMKETIKILERKHKIFFEIIETLEIIETIKVLQIF